MAPPERIIIVEDGTSVSAANIVGSLVLPASTVYATKIGEGTYGEVFKVASGDLTWAIKVSKYGRKAQVRCLHAPIYICLVPGRPRAGRPAKHNMHGMG